MCAVSLSLHHPGIDQGVTYAAVHAGDKEPSTSLDLQQATRETCRQNLVKLRYRYRADTVKCGHFIHFTLYQRSITGGSRTCKVGSYGVHGQHSHQQEAQIGTVHCRELHWICIAQDNTKAPLLPDRCQGLGAFVRHHLPSGRTSGSAGTRTSQAAL